MPIEKGAAVNKLFLFARTCKYGLVSNKNHMDIARSRKDITAKKIGRCCWPKYLRSRKLETA